MMSPKAIIQVPYKINKRKDRQSLCKEIKTSNLRVKHMVTGLTHQLITEKWNLMSMKEKTTHIKLERDPKNLNNLIKEPSIIKIMPSNNKGVDS